MGEHEGEGSRGEKEREEKDQGEGGGRREEGGGRREEGGGRRERMGRNKSSSNYFLFLFYLSLSLSPPLPLPLPLFSRLDLETDFRKNQELDERLLVDMEGVTRVLKKSLGDLKDQLEVEMQCLQLDSSDDEEME